MPGRRGDDGRIDRLGVQLGGVREDVGDAVVAGELPGSLRVAIDERGDLDAVVAGEDRDMEAARHGAAADDGDTALPAGDQRNTTFLGQGQNHDQRNIMPDRWTGLCDAR